MLQKLSSDDHDEAAADKKGRTSVTLRSKIHPKYSLGTFFVVVTTDINA